MAHHDGGYSLLELLVAVALTLAVLLAGIRSSNQATHAAYAQPEAMDALERGRFALARIARELSSAGSGPTVDPAVGPLGQYFAAVHPRRIGVGGDDPETAREDALSWIGVPDTASQGILDSELVEDTLSIRTGPGCPFGDLACGIMPGMVLAIFDDVGRFDIRNVVSGSGASIVTRPHGQSAGSFESGMPVVEVNTKSYYFDPVQRQIRQHDTLASDVPLVDGVSDFRVRYFGRASPPRLPKPPDGAANCLYDATGSLRAELVTLVASDIELAPLPPELFRDGPWCGAGAMRFDADLFRVRYLIVSIQVQPVSTGTPGSAWRMVSGYEASIGVAPRNLQLD